MSETDKLIAVLERIERRLEQPPQPPLPPELTLLTKEQIMDFFQLKKSKFYELHLPCYVNGGTKRYRLSDLPEHIRAHMQTFDGKPLEKRPMKRREEKQAA